MIKREYFISYVQYSPDGSSVFRAFSTTLQYKSWSEDPASVLNKAIAMAEQELIDYGVERPSPHIVAFNRV